MTGRLRGTCSGRPVEIEAVGRELLFRVPNLLSAWRLRRGASLGAPSLLRVFRAKDLRVRLQVGAWLMLDVLPRPSLIIRLLTPAFQAS
jgi:hypothetical protein